MRPDAARARALASRVVEMATAAGAGEAEVLVAESASSLTRFANNHIHQNVSWEDSGISVRAVIGKRVGVASTNRVDDPSLSACCDAAVQAARLAPEDPDFPGLPAPSPVTVLDRVSPATEGFGAAERAAAVEAIVTPSASRGLNAAGSVAVSEDAVAIANSLGVESAMPATTCRATVLCMGPDEGSGWASFVGRDADAIDAAGLGLEAASLAERSAHPRDLEPGDYTVILGPEAVGDVVQYLGWYGGSIKTVEEGRSFMTGNAGRQIMSESVSIFDDAMAPEAIGLTFDFEGMPKTRVVLVDEGKVGDPVTDSYWAAKTGRPDTGHALPAPASFGPIPLDLQMSPGTSSLEDLVASVDRGVYVTRFHYVNIEDPVKATLTGMTRDGTFMIERGQLTDPIRNLRFTQSMVESLATVGGITRDRRLIGEQAGVLVPYLLLERFAFTGQTR